MKNKKQISHKHLERKKNSFEKRNLKLALIMSRTALEAVCYRPASVSPFQNHKDWVLGSCHPGSSYNP